MAVALTSNIEGTNTLAYFGTASKEKKNREHIHNTSFYSYLKNRHKLDCLITIGWKGLPGTNALAYWAPK